VKLPPFAGSMHARGVPSVADFAALPNGANKSEDNRKMIATFGAADKKVRCQAMCELTARSAEHRGGGME